MHVARLRQSLGHGGGLELRFAGALADQHVLVLRSQQLGNRGNFLSAMNQPSEFARLAFTP
jgi:hypothetical protein